MTSFDDLRISLEILSKLVALLLGKLETPAKNSERVKGDPSSDSNFSKLLSIWSRRSLSWGVGNISGPKSDEKLSPHFSGVFKSQKIHHVMILLYSCTPLDLHHVKCLAL